MLTDINTEVCEENTYTAEDLKEIAREARARKVKPKEEVQIDVSVVDSIVAEIVEYMLAAAKEGEMRFEYAFEDNPRELMIAVSNTIRQMYPQNLMIIKDGGRNALILDWSGKNEV